VLDSGADLAHPDLAGRLWVNRGEIPGNGRDDDRDGFVDDVHGADVVDRDRDPADANGHGTHVAGIVAARAGNGIGVAGMAPRARLMIVRVLDGSAAGSPREVARGIRYALAHGARILNLSVATRLAAPPLRAALDDAACASHM
jgi:subtilisin family serine protease